MVSNCFLSVSKGKHLRISQIHVPLRLHFAKVFVPIFQQFLMYAAIATNVRRLEPGIFLMRGLPHGGLFRLTFGNKHLRLWVDLLVMSMRETWYSCTCSDGLKGHCFSCLLTLSTLLASMNQFSIVMKKNSSFAAWKSIISLF